MSIYWGGPPNIQSCVQFTERNMDAIFTSEKLDKSGELVNAINNLAINNTGYELNKATASDSQGDLTGDPDIVTHTSNGPDTVTHASNGILE